MGLREGSRQRLRAYGESCSNDADLLSVFFPTLYSTNHSTSLFGCDGDGALESFRKASNCMRV